MDNRVGKPPAGGTGSLDPLSLAWNALKAATAAVPATRYAIAIAGVAGGMAIAAQLLGKSAPGSIRNTLIGVAGMLALMTIMVVFAALARIAPISLRVPALFLMWTMLVLLVSASFLTGSCLFFCWPKCFPDLTAQLIGVAQGDAKRTTDNAVDEIQWQHGMNKQALDALRDEATRSKSPHGQ